MIKSCSKTGGRIRNVWVEIEDKCLLISQFKIQEKGIMFIDFTTTLHVDINNKNCINGFALLLCFLMCRFLSLFPLIFFTRVQI